MGKFFAAVKVLAFVASIPGVLLFTPAINACDELLGTPELDDCVAYQEEHGWTPAEKWGWVPKWTTRGGQ